MLSLQFGDFSFSAHVVEVGKNLIGLDLNLQILITICILVNCSTLFPSFLALEAESGTISFLTRAVIIMSSSIFDDSVCWIANFDEMIRVTLLSTAPNICGRRCRSIFITKSRS